MKYIYTLDIQKLSQEGNVWVNDIHYQGKLSIGDTLTVLGVDYLVQGFEDDWVIVKDLGA